MMHKLLMVRRLALAAGLLLTILLLGADPAKATDFTFTTGNFYMDYIGNDGTQKTNFDTLTLTGVSDTTVSLALGESKTVAISTVDFGVGLSCYDYPGCSTNDHGNAPFSVTVNTTQTGTLSPIFTDVIGSYDTLTIGSASVWIPVAGGFLEVTSLPYGPVVNGGGDAPGTLDGTFTYTATTPEPVSMVLFGTFMGAAGILRRRRRS